MAISLEPRILFLIALGGALGAVARYLAGLAITRTAFPLGTLVVNVAGTFLLALLLFHDLATGSLGANGRAFIGIGLLGAFTTMSTMGFETISLLDQGHHASAAWNAAANLGLSLAAAFAGRALALAITGPAPTG